MLRTTMAVTGLLLFAGAAAAQTASAPQPTAAQAAAASDPTSAQIASWIAGRHGEVEGVEAAPAQPLRDGQVHGEVGATVGSGGYRGGYGVATVPIGQRGDLTVGVSSEHLGGGNRTYGPPGSGYGGERRSLFVGVDLTGQGNASRCGAASIAGPRRGFSTDPPCQNDDGDRAPATTPER